MKYIIILVILVSLIFGGWLIYDDKRGVKVELTYNDSLQAAASVSAPGNPNLERKTIDGVDSLVFAAKIHIKNKESQSATVTFVQPGQLFIKTPSNRFYGDRFVNTAINSPTKKVVIWNVDAGESTKTESQQVTIGARTQNTYIIQITIPIKDLINGTYAMKLHTNAGGYTTDLGNTRSIYPISNKISHTVKIENSPATTLATGNNTNTAPVITSLPRSFTFPTTNAILKKGQTYQIALTGKTDDIRFATEKLILWRLAPVSGVANNQTAFHPLGYFNPTTRVYSFTVPRDLVNGKYQFHINGSNVLRSPEFTIED